MKYIEITGDLFTAPIDNVLVHCISSDLALGAGIAKVFRDKYKVRNCLLAMGYQFNWDGAGYCVITDSYINNTAAWKVANLITKPLCYNKPTYETIA